MITFVVGLLTATWFDKRKKTNDKTINPSAGYVLDLTMDIEQNDFIDSLLF